MSIAAIVKEILLNHPVDRIKSQTIKAEAKKTLPGAKPSTVDSALYHLCRREPLFVKNIGRGYYQLNPDYLLTHKDKPPEVDELTEAQTGRAIILYVEQLQKQFAELSGKYSEETQTFKKLYRSSQRTLADTEKKLDNANKTLESQRKHIREQNRKIANAGAGKTLKLGEIARFKPNTVP